LAISANEELRECCGALMFATAAAGGIVLPAWLPAKADEFEVTKTDAEWRSILTPAQYDVLRARC
jgi:hypothetical protein